MKTHAYTLIEVLIAMAIFALIAAISCQGLNSLIRQKEVLDLRSKEYAQLQKISDYLRRDCELAVDFQVQHKAFSGKTQNLSLWRLYQQTAQDSKLEKIQYDFSNHQLKRIELNDAGSQTTYLRDLKNIQFKYLDSQHNWHTEWPVNALHQEHLPRAVQVNILLESGKKRVWIYSLQANNWLEEGEREYEKSLPS